MFFLNTVTFPPFIWRNWLCFLVCSHQKSSHISSSSGTWTAGNSKHFWTNYVKKKSICYMNTLFGCLNKYVLPWSTMLPDNRWAGGQRPYCTWDLGAVGIGGRISTGTVLQLITSALSSAYVVATGKTEQFLANRKDATGPNEAFVNSLGVNVLSWSWINLSGGKVSSG